MSRQRIDVFLVAALAVMVGVSAGCASPTPATSPMTGSVAAPTGSTARTDDRVAAARCTQRPPAGQLTQAPGGVLFRTGRVFVDVARVVPVTAPGVVAAPDGEGTAGDGCRVFPKWGNDDPLVPPDSALFVFKSEGTDGVQIEAPIAELVSRRDVTAQIGVVAEDRYFQAVSCALTMSSFTEVVAAGSFTCPNAVLVRANPFRPDDTIDPTDRSPEPQAPSAPPPPVGVPGTVAPDTTPTAVLSGWFELRR